MFISYLKVALRNILKHKGYSLINIAGLAIGMACFILIFLWVRDELSYDRFHKNADNLYRAIVEHPDGVFSVSPWALAPTLKNNYPEIIKATRFVYRTALLRYGEKCFYEEGGLVDADFFEMFSFPFVKGTPEKAFQSVNSVVISEKIARKYFGDDEPIGKVLNMNNQLNLAVTGIIKNVPSNSHLQFDFISPVQLAGEDKLSSWSFESITYLLLQNHSSPNEVRKKIAGIIKKYDKRTDMEPVLDIQPLVNIHLYPLRGTGLIIYIYIFSSIAVIVLLIACMNYMNLSTARSSARAKEIGIRKTVGAAKTNLIKQFLGESILMSFIAMLLAIVLVLLFLPEFNSLASKQLVFHPGFFHLLGLVLIIIVTGVISGSYTALVLSSFQPVNILKNFQGSGAKRHILRKVLVVTQFACAVTLIICTAVTYSQLNYIQNKHLGFDKNHIVSIPINSEIREKYNVIKNEILRNQDILNVTSATSMPINITSFNPVYWEGRTPDQYVVINFASVDYDYFATFNMEIVDGRSFSREFSTDQQNYIVNEAAVRLMGIENPLGKLFSIWKNKGEIIGIVKDFHSKSLHDEINPIVFTLSPKWQHAHMFVRIKPDHVTSTLNYLKNTITQFAPRHPFEYLFLDEAFGNQYTDEQRVGTIFTYFTLLAIFISCLGLFGLISYTAEQKTKEIGIRKVYGASAANIIYMIASEFVRLVVLASVIAFPVAYYAMHKWLQNYAYHTNINIWIFFLSALLSIMVAILAVSYQSFKAAAANPIKSLKYE